MGRTAGHYTRTEIARLCATLFGATPLEDQCRAWAVADPRFAAFLDTYQGKIGKKLRGAGDEAGYLDILAELDVARRLLRERSFTLVYEPTLAEKQRGPDFAAIFKTHTTCNVEVRRLRPSSSDLVPRLVAVLGDKLRQMPPSVPNVLALAGEVAAASAEPVQAALRELLAGASAGDDDASRHRGFASARDALRHMERLSAVALLAPAIFWEHPRARHPLPPDLRKALARTLGGSPA